MKEKSISLLELRQRNTRKVAALFLAPITILMVVYIFYPIVDTFITSGYQWNGISAAKKFIGLGNWTKLLKDMNFWIAFRNNIVIMILSICIQFPDVVIGLFAVVIFVVFDVISSAKNDVIMNVSFVNMGGNNIRIFPL